jgi:hypothetical protein
MMLGHLRFEHLLEHPLDNLAQEAGIVEQDLLHRLRVHPTMICGQIIAPFRSVDF